MREIRGTKTALEQLQLPLKLPSVCS